MARRIGPGAKHRASSAAQRPIGRRRPIIARPKGFPTDASRRSVCDFPATVRIHALHCPPVKRRLAHAPRIPTVLDEIARQLEPRGAAVHLVGDALRDGLIEAPLPLRSEADGGAAPRRFTLVTDARPDALIEGFATAVPTARDGACFRLNTVAGAVDLHPLPEGRDLADHLAARDFTQFAMAVRLGPSGDRSLIDPHGGRGDLESGTLRAVGDPGVMLDRDPVRALRAIRLFACEGDALEPALREALDELPSELLGRASPHRLRRELDALLLSDRVLAALRLLRATDLERALAEGVEEGAAERVAAQPPRVHLRLAAWLLGARTGRALRRLRYSPHVANRVLAFVASHPIERCTAWQRPSNLRKLAQRLDADDRRALIALRRQELAREPDPEASEALEQLERALVALEQDAALPPRPKLAVDGRVLIDALALEPGPQLGALLDHLRRAVDEGRTSNDREALIALARTRLAGGAGAEPRPSGSVRD